MVSLRPGQQAAVSGSSGPSTASTGPSFARSRRPRGPATSSRCQSGQGLGAARTVKKSRVQLARNCRRDGSDRGSRPSAGRPGRRPSVEGGEQVLAFGAGDSRPGPDRSRRRPGVLTAVMQHALHRPAERRHGDHRSVRAPDPGDDDVRCTRGGRGTRSGRSGRAGRAGRACGCDGAVSGGRRAGPLRAVRRRSGRRRRRARDRGQSGDGQGTGRPPPVKPTPWSPPGVAVPA